jgi:CheY-like chemotaxis protein
MIINKYDWMLRLYVNLVAKQRPLERFVYNGLILHCKFFEKMKPIYIVDDSADQRYLLGYFLKRINPEFQILIFERAQPLIDTLSLSVDTVGVIPLVIFLDLQMPGMDGFEALRIIRQSNGCDEDWSNVPIVIYSSHSDQDIIQRCFSAGAFAVIQKPVDPDELRNVLASIPR